MEADTGGVKGERGVSGQRQPFGSLLTRAGDFNMLETLWNIISTFFKKGKRRMHSLSPTIILQMQNNGILHCLRREIINNAIPLGCKINYRCVIVSGDMCIFFQEHFQEMRLTATQARE